MASGDLDRIESAFAEAVLDSGLWSRVLDLTEIGIFRTLPPRGDARIPAERHHAGRHASAGTVALQKKSRN